MANPAIALLTDFGERDGYVAQMKGVILGIAPEARLVDVSHEIAPQNLRQAALLLDSVVDAFPLGTIFVTVVDPGVGSDRRLIAAEALGKRFLAPDNGLFDEVLSREPSPRIHELQNARFWRGAVSKTFHGRDVFAPVAAHWSRGAELADFGPAIPASELVQLPRLEVHRSATGVTGEIVAVDHFGNLITNIRGAQIPENVRSACIVRIADRTLRGIRGCYAECPAGELLVLFGSSDRLEIAASGASAARILDVHEGVPVVVEWGADKKKEGL